MNQLLIEKILPEVPLPVKYIFLNYGSKSMNQEDYEGLGKGVNSREFTSLDYEFIKFSIKIMKI